MTLKRMLFKPSPRAGEVADLSAGEGKLNNLQPLNNRHRHLSLPDEIRQSRFAGLGPRMTIEQCERALSPSLKFFKKSIKTPVRALKWSTIGCLGFAERERETF